MSKSKYIFKSKRLGFRNWTKEDFNSFAEMNEDADVMEYFPKKLTKQKTKEFIYRLLKHYNKHGYNYFATEILSSRELIGFIGLAYQDYGAEFNPSTDIGWRLKKSAWNKGYATEGAKRCLEFGQRDLKINFNLYQKKYKIRERNEEDWND